MELTRRDLLADTIGIAGTIGTATLAGCTGDETGRTSTAIYVTNETDETLTATLRVVELESGEEILVRRAELSTDQQLLVDGEELPAEPLGVGLAVRGGQNREYDWDRIDELSTLDVRIESGSVRFTELD